jgi:hypothetical protein
MRGSKQLWVVGVLVGGLMIAAVGLTVASPPAVSWAHPGHDHGGSDSGGSGSKGGGTKSGATKGSAGRSASEPSGSGAAKQSDSSNDPRSICPDESGKSMPCAGKRS